MTTTRQSIAGSFWMISLLAFLFVGALAVCAGQSLNVYPCPDTNPVYVGGLTHFTDGSYYGAAADYNGIGPGFVYRLSPAGSSWNCTVIFQLGGEGGGVPQGNVTFDSQGNLYITNTQYGGAGLGGVVELSPDGSGGWMFSRGYSFTGNGDGAAAVGSVSLDAAGNVYGITAGASIGGTAYPSTVFELSPTQNGFSETTLHTFGGPGDGYRGSSLIMDRGGNLYGTTTQGGSGQHGTVFRLHHVTNGWIETILHNFSQRDGNGDPTSLVFDPQGNLVGTAVDAVFKITPPAHASGAVEAPWPIRWLHQFQGDGPGGSQPFGGVAFDSAGNIYGATVNGGNLQGCGPDGCGVVYKLSRSQDGSPASWSETVLWTFAGGSDGGGPTGSVLVDGSGNVFGTNYDGPFKLTPQ